MFAYPWGCNRGLGQAVVIGLFGQRWAEANNIHLPNKANKRWISCISILYQASEYCFLCALIGYSSSGYTNKQTNKQTNSYLFSMIVRVRVVFRKTVVGDWRFNYLSGSHLQSQVKSCCRMMVFMPLVMLLDWSVLSWCDWSAKHESCSDWSVVVLLLFCMSIVCWGMSVYELQVQHFGFSPLSVGGTEMVLGLVLHVTQLLCVLLNSVPTPTLKLTLRHIMTDRVTLSTKGFWCRGDRWKWNIPRTMNSSLKTNNWYTYLAIIGNWRQLEITGNSHTWRDYWRIQVTLPEQHNLRKDRHLLIYLFIFLIHLFTAKGGFD